MSEWVLDSSAVLAVIHGEPGAAVVLTAIAAGAVIGAVNLSETVTKLSDDGLSAEDIRETIERLALQCIALDESLAYQSGLLRAATRHAGLSLGDRACLALGQHLGLPVLTADRNWQGLNIGVDIRLVR